MMASLLVTNALLILFVGAVVLRSQWARRENQLLALTALLDAGRDIAIATVLARGVETTNALPMHLYLVGRILIVYPVLEFAYAFPSGARPPRWMRQLALAATFAAMLLALHPVTGPYMSHWGVVLVFFLPFFAASVAVMGRNVRDMKSDRAARGARRVLIALTLRFTADLCTQVIVRFAFPSAYEVALIVDAVIATLSYALVMDAVLRYRLFRVPRVLGEGVLYSAVAMGVLSLVVMAVELVTQRVSASFARWLLLAALVLMPLAGWLLARRFAPGLATRLLSPIDPWRRVATGLLEKALHDSASLVDASAICDLTTRAIAAVSGGTAVLWRVSASADAAYGITTSGPAIPEALAQHLRDTLLPSIHQRRIDELPSAVAEAFLDMGADALVTVRAHDTLLGVYAIQSNILDNDTLDTAVALADNLGNKLAQCAMYERAFDLQIQLEAARRLATLGSFTAAIAHDIRTPLTSLKMNLQMIRGYENLASNTRECVDIALCEVHRMNDYVSGLLDYVKPVQLRPIELDLRSLIDETTRTLQPILESRKVELLCEYPGLEALPSLRADPSRLKQVLVNLLENAADASAPGSIIRLIATAGEGNQLTIRIIDQGDGIDPANLARVFEPFFTTRAEGTGLGLAIVKKLALAHDGDVSVESVQGSGSTFTLTLPLRCADHAPALSPSAEE